MTSPSVEKSFRLPLGGWNTRDSLSTMNDDPNTAYAVELENWIPGLSTLTARQGTKMWVSLDGVKSLYSYNSTVNQLFAFTDDAIFDITNPAITPVDQLVTLTSGLMRCINYSVANTQYLVCCNGVDAVLIYDGTDWTSLDGTSTPPLEFPAGSSFTSADVIVVKEHQSRLWMLASVGLSAYYLDVAAIGGTLTEFPMGSIFRRGGYLVDMETWTVDGGSGTGDFFAFLTSEGEVAIYSGYDPTQAETWGWTGVFFVGIPVGRKPLQRFGGDVLCLTLNGLGLLSKLLPTAEINNSAMISDTINKTFAAVTLQYQGNEGWQIHESPRDNLLFVNIPVSAGEKYDQYVMYTLTNAWTKFTGIDCTCMAQFEGKVYFGGLYGMVTYYTEDAQYVDVTNPYRLFIQFAYSYLGSKGKRKKPTLLRPAIRMTSVKAQTYELCLLTWGIDVDFKRRPTISSVNEVPLIYADTIGTGVIGGMQIGAREFVLQTIHTIHSNIGFAFSPQLEMYSQGTKWEFIGLEALVQYGNFLS